MTNPADEDDGRERDPRWRQRYERERRRRQAAQEEIVELKAELAEARVAFEQRAQAVSYRLGQAIVRALRPSLDTLKLPVRVVRLALEALRKRRVRRAGGTVGESVPDAGAGRFEEAPPCLRRADDLVVAAVTDEFSWWAWKYEADVFTFKPERWLEVLERRQPDVLLVESTWRGVEDSWYYQLRHCGSRKNVQYELPRIVEWCRGHDVPAVFYNKEDPPNFDVFIDAARHFDIVFTSDENCVPAYRERVGHDRVHSLPFAAQPRIHNPVLPAGGRVGDVCFAGTWYSSRHPARQEDARRILEPALDFGLHIYDRMAGTHLPGYEWPAKFHGALRGGLPYAEMVETYKKYKVFLNVNSVQDSPTMFSRRVFELLACGTPVISSYSEAIERVLGPDVVLMSGEAETTREHLQRLLSDDEYRRRLALRGQRCVLSAHTYTSRLARILEKAGVEPPEASGPSICAIALVETDEDALRAWRSFERQSWPRKELVLCSRGRIGAIPPPEAATNSVVARVIEPGAEARALLERALRATSADFIAAWHADAFYGESYLLDYANATRFLEVPLLGKGAVFHLGKDRAGVDLRPGAEYQRTDVLHPWTVCAARPFVLSVASDMTAASAEEWWSALVAKSPGAYASDRYNFVDGAAAAPAPESSSSRAAAIDLSADVIRVVVE